MALEPRPQFVDENPNTLVENVYPAQGQVDIEPGQDPELDDASWQNMTDFLVRRHENVEADITRDGVTILRPHTETQLGFDRWAYLPPVKTGRGWRRATAAGFLAINLLINLNNIKTLAQDVKEEIAVVADDVSDFFSDGTVCETPNETVKTVETETERQTSSFFISANDSGEFTPSSQSVRQALQSIATALEGGKEVEVELTSVASDEWLSLPDADRGIGSETQQNTDLAQQRSDEFKAALDVAAEEQNVDLNGVTFSATSSERVLSEVEATDLLGILDAFGLSVDDAILAANQGRFEDLPTEVRDQLTNLILDMRGVQINITATEEHTSSVVEVTPGDTTHEDCPDPEPTDENRDYDWKLLPFLWPALPLFMRRKITKMVPEQYITEQLNPLDVLVHPNGADENRTEMRENVWAYLRKYMHLLREDERIQKVQELGYEDKEGEQQVLRVMYVDHQPSEETQAMVRDVLETATTITGGQLGKDVDMIAIYPRESAGRQAGNRRGRDIALGLDTQYSAGTLGVAYGNLGLVELHMDQLPTAKDLDQAHMSAKWTLVHELLGHFTQLNENVNQRELIAIGQAPDGRMLYDTNFPWSNAGIRTYQQAAAFANQMAQPKAKLKQIRWQAWMPGETDPIEIRGISDPRLLEAERLELQSVNPTQYGDSNHLEAWAEAAASHITQVAAPFEVSAVQPVRDMRRTRPDQGIGGTIVNKEWVDELMQVWGQLNDQERAHVEQSWQHRFGNPDEFEFMQDLATFARQAEIWAQNDPRWVRIITGQLFDEKK